MKDTFALDVDGVVLDITPGAINYIKEKYGKIITADNITDWDWDYALSIPEGVTPEFWMSVWNTPAKPYPWGDQFIQQLQDNGYRVIAISNRPKKWKGIGDVAYRAALRDFDQLPFDEVYLTETTSEKPGIIKKEKAIYLIEDNPITAARCFHETGVRTFLMTRPWNARCITVTDAWQRVSGYESAFDTMYYG